MAIDRYRFLMKSKILNNLPFFILLAGGVILIFIYQFWIPTLYGADGYLHIRMAEFIKQYGFKYDFVWAKFSTFADHFSDKDFLYHLLLIPFTFFKNIFWGAKLAAAIFASVLFFGYAWLTKKIINKYLAPLALAAFFGSGVFLEAISNPRPTSLVILADLFLIYFTIKKKYWWLFGLAVAYNLGHVTGPLAVGFVFIAEIIRFFNHQKFNYKTLAFAAAGAAVGILIHPNFPNNILVFYLNSILVPLLAAKGGVLEFGAEFFPITTREIFSAYPVVIFGIFSFFITAGFAKNQVKFSTKVYLAFAAIFFVAALSGRRYFIQGYPIILLALFSYFSDIIPDKFILKNFIKSKKITAAVIALLLAVSLYWLSVNTYQYARYNALSNRIYNDHYERIGNWMAKNLPPGQTIFHANWSDSQFFIGLNPKDYYFVTLDPIYMYYKNKERYQLYRDIAFGKTEDPYTELKKFGVNFGYASKNYFGGLITQLRNDDRFQVLAEDNFGLIFMIK